MMHPRTTRPGATFSRLPIVLWLLSALLTSRAHTEDQISFNRDIRPILSDKCFFCHGTDKARRDSGRRLDIASGPEGAYAKKDDIIAIKPGDLEGSDAWVRIHSEDRDEKMPPPKSHKTLSKAEKEVIRQWILEGAKYQAHWAFEPPVKTAPPPLSKSSAVAGNEIDAFLQSRLEKEHLAPSPLADQATLLRRATLAITGLPPTPAEVDAFAADVSPDAYEKLVDRLLASPRFGEHMAHWWLDLARYGDTHGLHLDNARDMWLYRDWVIGAFNRNLPFDQFTIEQLAGDQLPQATLEQKIASGFNRCNVTTAEGGAIKEEFLFRYAIDRATTTGQTWLALTFQCAVCHDHKFDPIAQKETYELYAFFNSNGDPAMDGNKVRVEPILKVPTAGEEKKLTELGSRLDAAKKRLADGMASTLAAYTDPADAPDAETPREIHEVWMEDSFPGGVNVQANPGTPPLQFVGTEEMPPATGQLAIKRTADGIGQDFFSGGATFKVPPKAIFSVMVRTDPANLPRALMIQFHVPNVPNGNWDHRAVWGEKGVITYGKPDTSEHFSAGSLPSAAGQWTQLDIPAEKIGLNAGDVIDGFSFAQFDGVVFWDHLAVRGVDFPAHDPLRSLAAWLAASEGKDTPNVPPEVSKLRRKAAAKRTPDEKKALRDYFLQNVCLTSRDALAPLAKEVASLDKERTTLDAALPSSFIMHDLDRPRASFVMKRGQYDQPGEKVEPGTPAILPPLAAADPARPRRLDLARWLVEPKNPLTARVAVNRFWQQFFGVGLVKTSSDFGSQGEAPTHPELLDWLAVDFRENGWDMKRLVKMIVTSAAWRQSSRAAPELIARDPENRLLARGPRLRLNAEAIRDEALFVSGALVEKPGGPGVKPYQPANIWEPVGFAGSNTRNYQQDHGAALYRRSIYAFLKRTAPPPFLANFDAPSREQSCTRRERSDTPLQALQLLNDVQFFEAARGLAQRILALPDATPGQRMAEAFRLVLARAPEPAEAGRVTTLLDQFLEQYRADNKAAKAVIANGESKPSPSLDPAELAAWTQVANLLLNLDENLTIN